MRECVLCGGEVSPEDERICVRHEKCRSNLIEENKLLHDELTAKELVITSLREELHRAKGWPVGSW